MIFATNDKNTHNYISWKITAFESSCHGHVFKHLNSCLSNCPCLNMDVFFRWALVKIIPCATFKRVITDSNPCFFACSGPNHDTLSIGLLENIFPWNVNQNVTIFIQENALEIVICKMLPFCPNHNVINNNIEVFTVYKYRCFRHKYPILLSREIHYMYVEYSCRLPLLVRWESPVSRYIIYANSHI